MKLFDCFRVDTRESLEEEIQAFYEILTDHIIELQLELDPAITNKDNHASCIDALRSHEKYVKQLIREFPDNAERFILQLADTTHNEESLSKEIGRLESFQYEIKIIFAPDDYRTGPEDFTDTSNPALRSLQGDDIDYKILLHDISDESIADNTIEDSFQFCQSRKIASQGIDLVQRRQRFLSEPSREDNSQESKFYIDQSSPFCTSNSEYMYDSFSQDEDIGGEVVYFN